MKKTLAILIIAAGLLPAIASASLIRIQGESFLPGVYSSWEVVGHNTNGDGHLRTFEVTEFSGITILGFEFRDLYRFVFNLESDTLSFMKVANGHGHHLLLIPQMFRISIEDMPVGVPEPRALVLIGLVLIGLAFRRRRREPAAATA
jgi:hypothetical protein